MKKAAVICMGMLVLCGLSGNVRAEDIKLASLPNLKEGFVYSVSEKELSDVTSLEVLNWNDLTLDAGYYKDEATNEHTGILAVAYKLGGLEKFGIKVPLAKYLDTSVGYYVGAERIERGETPSLAHGIYATLIKVAF